MVGEFRYTREDEGNYIISLGYIHFYVNLGHTVSFPEFEGDSTKIDEFLSTYRYRIYVISYYDRILSSWYRITHCT